MDVAGKYTSLCDVWSYGILMWEIFSAGQQPYTGWTNAQAREKIDGGGCQFTAIFLGQRILLIFIGWVGRREYSACIFITKKLERQLGKHYDVLGISKRVTFCFPCFLWWGSIASFSLLHCKCCVFIHIYWCVCIVGIQIIGAHVYSLIICFWIKGLQSIMYEVLLRY